MSDRMHVTMTDLAAWSIDDVIMAHELLNMVEDAAREAQESRGKATSGGG